MQTIQYTDARNQLNKLINSVEKNKEPVVIVGSKGRNDAVILSKEDYDNLLENLYVLSNPNWMQSIKKGLKDIESGRTKKLSSKEVLGF
ncbi:MAG: type II toxin-antitoxin system Phd/YefM family antitoxin [Melioribacteraceae bacterium]|nr:type II toxin-antitoxin system Phd/YefM family antitoxin [Melioribacteraceae bacterium]MDD3558888.1 type II toxin-antitoxin system Phd/YefM family antitoxin [Melioribacteraceae bacterium]